MQILVCCGVGVGSSFMMEMNVKKVLKELGVSDVEVSHSDLTSARGSKAELFIATRDLADGLRGLDGELIELRSMIDMNELKTKLKDKLTEMGVIK